MKTFSVRVEDDIFQRIEAFAVAEGKQSRNEAANALIRLGLAKDACTHLFPEIAEVCPAKPDGMTSNAGR